MLLVGKVKSFIILKQQDVRETFSLFMNGHELGSQFREHLGRIQQI
jgi:hypothetical protein